MNALKLAAGDGKLARFLGTDRHHHRVIIAQQTLDRDIDADMAVGMELDTFGAHLRDAAVDGVFLELEIGNAVAQEPADPRRLLENGDIMAGPRELLRAGQARRPRADDRDAPVGAARGDLRLDPAFLPAALDNGVLDGLDGDRLLDEVQG